MQLKLQWWLSLKVDESETLSVNYDPSYASNKEITWSSSNKQIATVENGKITAKKPGTTEIKAVSKEGKYEATCKVTVLSAPIESIKFEKEEQVGRYTLPAFKTYHKAVVIKNVWYWCKGRYIDQWNKIKTHTCRVNWFSKQTGR